MKCPNCKLYTMLRHPEQPFIADIVGVEKQLELKKCNCCGYTCYADGSLPENADKDC